MLKLVYKVGSRGGAMVSTSGRNAGDPWFESRRGMTDFCTYIHTYIYLYIYLYIYIYIVVPNFQMPKIGYAEMHKVLGFKCALRKIVNVSRVYTRQPKTHNRCKLTIKFSMI